ncbi:MAG: hypothetical protein Q8R00_03580 [Candidatus Nanoarchaeia archaeon]|nr:hypothetical protein [Candidatus Nanoarchaeia archaeon]
MKDKLKESIDHLLSLKEGWDDADAKPIQKATIDKALSYMPKILEKIKELWDLELKVEYFSPVQDGSIDIELRKDPDYHILFNIPPEKLTPTYSGQLTDETTHYYGDLK